MVIAGTSLRSSDVPLENFQQFIHILLLSFYFSRKLRDFELQRSGPNANVEEKVEV